MYSPVWHSVKKLTVQGLAGAMREAIEHQNDHQHAIELGDIMSV
ncbi:MAG TPA: hypothetical protein V6D26_09380 [Stenomitos sp.]